MHQVGADRDDATKADGGAVGLHRREAIQCAADRCFGLPSDIGPAQPVQMGARVAVEGEIRQGVVDQHIRGTKAVSDLIVHCRHLRGVSHISAKRGGTRAKFSGQRLGRHLAVAEVDGDPCTFAVECTGDGGPKAAASAGDKNGQIRDWARHGVFPLNMA